MTSTSAKVAAELTRFLGADGARCLRADVLRELALPELLTPEHVVRFGEALVQRGGRLEPLGHHVKVLGYLAGAAMHRPRTTS